MSSLFPLAYSAGVLLLAKCSARQMLLACLACVVAFAQGSNGHGIYVRSASLWPQLERALKASAARLEKPGREVNTYVAAVTDARTGAVKTYSVTIAYPDRLVLRDVTAPKSWTLFFDARKSSTLEALPQDLYEVAETLLTTSSEYFFSWRTRGGGIRNVVFDAIDGKQPTVRPARLLNVFQLLEPGAPASTPRLRVYAFDANTHRLARVSFRHPVRGTEVDLAVTEWAEIQGEAVPVKLQRTEAGREALTIQLSPTGFRSRDAVSF